MEVFVLLFQKPRIHVTAGRGENDTVFVNYIGIAFILKLFIPLNLLRVFKIVSLATICSFFASLCYNLSPGI
jgi:hypothetical protein